MTSHQGTTINEFTCTYINFHNTTPLSNMWGQTSSTSKEKTHTHTELTKHSCQQICNYNKQLAQYCGVGLCFTYRNQEREEKCDVTLPWQHYFWMKTKPTMTETTRRTAKNNRFLLTKQQLCTFITLSCTILFNR